MRPPTRKIAASSIGVRLAVGIERGQSELMLPLAYNAGKEMEIARLFRKI
jgi:hypothetical protein